MFEVHPDFFNVDYAQQLETAIARMGFSGLYPEQRAAIEAILNGKDVLAILPTGGGKSAIYTIPSLVTGKTTLVISPLIALMEDQVRELRQRRIPAFTLHSGISDIRKEEIYKAFRKGTAAGSLLFISPELLSNSLFFERMQGVKFDLLAIDEAHCISTWGNYFRIEYHLIKKTAKLLGIPQTIAVTATTDHQVESDILRYSPLNPERFVRISKSPYRDNIELQILRQREGRFKALLGMLGDPAYYGPALVYVNTRRLTVLIRNQIADKKGFLASHKRTCHLMHGGLPQIMKDEVLNALHNKKRPIIVTTSAFGMGINCPNIRQVIHYDTPHDLFSYAQQFGRAGRAGAGSIFPCAGFLYPG